MRANISSGEATNVNLCRQLQMQSTRLCTQPSRPIVASCLCIGYGRAYQMANFTNDAQQQYDLILHAVRIRSWSSTFVLNASFMRSSEMSIYVSVIFFVSRCSILEQYIKHALNASSIEILATKHPFYIILNAL